LCLVAVEQGQLTVCKYNTAYHISKTGQTKGQTDCLRARKKPNFIFGIAIPLSQKNSKLREY